MKVLFSRPPKLDGLLLLFFFTSALAKPLNSAPANSFREVTGKVTASEDDTPLPGVNIIIKGTSVGTTTKPDGTYSINVQNNDATLIFSFIGYESQEIPVGNRTVIDVSLRESIEMLDEAVVTALGIERETKSLTYSIGKVSGEDIVNVVQENVMNSLAARVPGLTLNQTSGVGSSVSIVIRGATSLSNDNQPLFVIDGVPMVNRLNNTAERGSRNNVDYGNVISDINPEDIESISVLKGPAASALYGSRAGNGVILITTKTGKKTKGFQITYTTSNVFEKPYRFLDMHYKHANGARIDQFNQGSAYWGGPELDKGNMAVQWDSPLDENGIPIPTELRSYKDNVKNFLQTGITSSHNLAVSGSNERGHFRVSFDMLRNQDMIPNSDLKRNSIGTAAEYKLNNWMRLSTNLNYVNSFSDNRPSTGNRGANPLDAVYKWSNVDIRKLKNAWVSGGEGIQQLTPDPGSDNPYFLAYGINNSFDRNHAYGNIRLDLSMSNGFSAYGRITHDWSQETRETKIPWSYTRAIKGAYHLDSFGSMETNMEAMLTYKKKVKDLDLVVSVGTNSMHRRYQSVYIGGQPLEIPGLYRISNIPNTSRTSSNFSNQKRIFSVFGTASLGYKDQLYLDVTGRNDWSSTLPINNRSYFYPSVGLSWVANNSFNLPNSVSMLKLYVNWAQTGNDTDPYQLNNSLGIGSWGDLITTSLPAVLRNPGLKPEIQTSQEVGLSLNLFKNRLTFEGTYFYMTNRNQILDVNSSPSSGYSQSKINAGQLSSRGIELSLGGTPLRTKSGWELSTHVNLSRIRTRVDELYGDLKYVNLWGSDENGGGAITFIGEEIGDIYSRGYHYVNDPNSPYYRWPILTDTGEYEENNDFYSREKVGNFNPRFIFGGQLTLRYKRLSLSASFDWRHGGEFLSWSYRYMESDWRSARQLEQLIPGGLYSPEELTILLKSDPEYYIIPQNGRFPRVGGHTKETGGLEFEGQYDGGFIPGVIPVRDESGNITSYIEHLGGPGTRVYPITDIFPWSFNKTITFDASFVKLREISLGYRFKDMGPFKNVNLSVYSRNIMLWTAAKVGIDPERAFRNDGTRFKQGIEFYNVYPWTMPFGFKASFTL